MTSPRRRLAPLALGAAVLTAALALGGCGGGEVTTDRATTTTAAPAPASTTTGGSSGTVAPDAPGVALVEFFLRGDDVGAAARRVAPTNAVARAALEHLLAGPDATERAAGLTTAITPGLTISSLAITDATASVTFSGDLAPAADRHRAEAQVVLTLTQFPTVTAVRIAGGAALTRAGFADVTPPILVLSPTPGADAASPVTVTGLNNTFESTFQAQLLDGSGRVLVTTTVTGKGEMGTWGPFSTTLTPPAPLHGPATVRVFDTSAETGARIDLVDVPVRFP